MLYIAIRMLMGDRAKYAGLVLGIAFTAFLVTFAASYFAGFMTRSFALIAENAYADVWVMDAAVRSVEPTTNLPESALVRVRSVPGVASALPLLLGSAEARVAGGRFQTFQVIGVDGASLPLPALKGARPATVLRAPNTIVVAAGGSEGKLSTPVLAAGAWPNAPSSDEAPLRELAPGDELLLNEHTVRVAGEAHALPRFPPRPLIYMPIDRAWSLLAPERRRLTFVLVRAAPSVSPAALAESIQARTGLRARTAPAFREDTVRWFLSNSEDVGDIASMLILAMSVGFGVAGIMLYMFTIENLPQYAVLSAMGTTRRMLLAMVFTQAGVAALIGLGIGFGLCAAAGLFAETGGYPFRRLWFTPLAGGTLVMVICIVAAGLSARPVLRLQPMAVFNGR